MYIVQHNIFRLYVPVNDPKRVNLIDSLANLFHQECRFLFGQIRVLFQVMIQLPACAHFQNNINVLVVIKVAVHLDDVGMTEVHLDFQFADELFRNFLLHQQFFLDHFESANKVCFLLPYFNKIITEPSTRGRTCRCPVTSFFKSLKLRVSFLSCQNWTALSCLPIRCFYQRCWGWTARNCFVSCLWESSCSKTLVHSASFILNPRRIFSLSWNWYLYQIQNFLIPRCWHCCLWIGWLRGKYFLLVGSLNSFLEDVGWAWTWGHLTFFFGFRTGWWEVGWFKFTRWQDCETFRLGWCVQGVTNFYWVADWSKV